MRLDLYVAGGTHSLHEIGPGMVCLREPLDLAPCDAIVVMTVDGQRHEWPVYLPDGLSANSREARTIDREPGCAAALAPVQSFIP